MNLTTPTRKRFLALALAAATAAAPLAVAQPKPAAQQQRAAGAASAAKSALDSLDESRLMTELASRNLDKLLDFYFTKNNVPDETRKEVVVLAALQQLDSPEFNKLPAAARKQKIDEIVANVNNVLPTISDPERLLRYAGALITNGTLRLVNVLDYWGDNPKTQAALQPVAETVDKILERAVKEAKGKADGILQKFPNPNQKQIDEWERLDNLQHLAEYTRSQAAYGLALSYDKAAAAKRKEVCQQAIEALKPFDEEGGGVRVPVELAIAKLSMALGADGYKQAKDYFAKVIAAKSDDANAPNKYVGLQYQARYFTLVADVLNKKPDEAEKGLAELKAWQVDNLPKDKATQQGVDAATSMLEYRVQAAKADLTHDAKAKEKYNAEAVSILMTLVTQRPDLRSIIFEQVMGKLPDNPQMDKLNGLLLEALVTRGVEDVQHKTPEKDDAKNIQLAADAAREIVRRTGQPGITPEQVDNAAFEIGVFEEQIGHTPQLKPDEQFQNKIDAATAYCDYVEKYGANKERANDALDNCLTLLSNMRKENANDDKVNPLYDRALNLGYFKVGRKQLALPFADRKREVHDFKTAAQLYAAVTGDNPQLQLHAKYYQMLCYQQMLTTAPDADKAGLAAKIPPLATDVNGLLDKLLAANTDPKVKPQLQALKAKTVLLAADVARSNKDAKRVVDTLANFESVLEGVPDNTRDTLLANALFLRVNGLMALNRNQEAIQQVQALIQRQNPEQALGTVATLLERLNEAFRSEKSKDNPDHQTLLVLAEQRATLGDLLVGTAQKDPKTPEKNMREYRLFQIGSLRTAAELEPDAAKKKTYLTKALSGYQELAKGLDANSSESAVFERLIALTEFEIGGPDNLQKAHDTLNGLFADKKFGFPMVRVGDETKMNEIYWEALLRLLQSKVQLAQLKNEPAMRDEAVRIMKLFVVIPFGDNAGGTYKKDFQALRKELLGDWKPEMGAPPATAPATAPVAAQ
jgi:hypothetical protein